MPKKKDAAVHGHLISKGPGSFKGTGLDKTSRSKKVLPKSQLKKVHMP